MFHEWTKKGREESINVCFATKFQIIEVNLNTKTNDFYKVNLQKDLIYLSKYFS